MELTRDVKRAALEEMIIATLIQDQDAAGEILSELTERDFRYPEWQGLMVAARKLHAEGLPIIEGTLAAFYGAEGYLFSAHADQAARTKTPEDFRWLITELKELSMLDSIKAAAERLNTVESMDEAVEIVSKINELTSARRGVKITRLGDAVQAYADSIGKKKPDEVAATFEKLENTTKEHNAFVDPTEWDRFLEDTEEKLLEFLKEDPM